MVIINRGRIEVSRYNNRSLLFFLTRYMAFADVAFVLYCKSQTTLDALVVWPISSGHRSVDAEYRCGRLQNGVRHLRVWVRTHLHFGITQTPHLGLILAGIVIAESESDIWTIIDCFRTYADHTQLFSLLGHGRSGAEVSRLPSSYAALDSRRQFPLLLSRRYSFGQLSVSLLSSLPSFHTEQSNQFLHYRIQERQGKSQALHSELPRIKAMLS